MTQHIENMLQALHLAQPVIAARNRRYRGETKLRFLEDRLTNDLKYFHVNLGRLAINSVSERMRVKKITATVRGSDVSDQVAALWQQNGLGSMIEAALTDAMAVGSAYLIVWADRFGSPTVTVESAEEVITTADPITGEITGAVKQWFEKDHQGVVVEEHVMYYGPDKITHYTRGANNVLHPKDAVINPLGVVPVVPLVNLDRITDDSGYSVLDDLGDLIDALSKIVADMLTASEDVARPRRWATGVNLDEADEDGFIADGSDLPVIDRTPVESPFDGGKTMWTAEDSQAKFGQLPGADLGGYRTAVDVLLQQIMAVSALPAHMVGVTSSNPASAEAIRSAEAALISRVTSRIRVFGFAVEKAVKLLTAIQQGVDLQHVQVSVVWADPATPSPAQEADAVTKLHSLGILTTEEARDKIGVDSL